jgi:hypothetical protein
LCLTCYNLAPKKEKLFELPCDFINPFGRLKAQEWDKHPANSRLKYADVFDMRLPHEKHGNLPVLSAEELEVKLERLRKAGMKWVVPRMEGYFVDGMLKKFPDELLHEGRPIASFAEFCEFYKNGPNDSRMREIVYYAINTVWTTNNQWAINFEQEFCELMGFKITDNRAGTGLPPKKPSQGKFFAKIFVRRKTALQTLLREIGRRQWGEAILHRTEKKGPGPIPKERNGIPPVLKIVNATREKFGFSGRLGVCEGHPLADCADTGVFSPDRTAVRTAAPPVVTPEVITKTSTGAYDGELQAFLELNLKRAANIDDLHGLLMQHMEVKKKEVSSDDDSAIMSTTDSQKVKSFEGVPAREDGGTTDSTKTNLASPGQNVSVLKFNSPRFPCFATESALTACSLFTFSRKTKRMPPRLTLA